MLGVKQDSNGRNPHAEDGVVHLELSPGLSRHHVAAVSPGAAKKYLEASAEAIEAVGNAPHDQEVVGLNPFGCRPFFFSLYPVLVVSLISFLKEKHFHL